MQTSRLLKTPEVFGSAVQTFTEISFGCKFDGCCIRSSLSYLEVAMQIGLLAAVVLVLGVAVYTGINGDSGKKKKR
jgi:hypothetical protein